MTKDNFTTCHKVGELSLYGTSDIVGDCTGDADIANVWYLALRGSGYAYFGP